MQYIYTFFTLFYTMTVHLGTDTMFKMINIEMDDRILIKYMIILNIDHRKCKYVSREIRAIKYEMNFKYPLLVLVHL